MAITLDTLTLPDGLRWQDEFAWSPITKTVTYSLTGALLVESSTKQAGRSITLIGGDKWAWLTRTELLALQTLLEAGEEMLLTLHDARTFSVISTGDDALTVTLIPIIMDSGPADPSADASYILESLKLIEV